MLVHGLYPWLQQTLVVEPNELAVERPYIEHNIAFTRQAYNLTQVKTEPFPAKNQLDQAVLAANQPTVGNIRLLGLCAPAEYLQATPGNSSVR
jgi:uncharacterized membrane protein (UPF0182 family)